MLDWFLILEIRRQSGNETSLSSFPNFIWGRCVGLVASKFCRSLPDNRFYVKSCLMLSIHDNFGLRFLLFLGKSFTIPLLPTYSSYLFSVVPLWPIFLVNFSHCHCLPLIISILILSNFVNQHIHHNILISATSNFFSCIFVTVHVSERTYLLVSLQTCIPPVDLQVPSSVTQCFYPDCTPWVISASKYPSSANIDPRYVNTLTHSNSPLPVNWYLSSQMKRECQLNMC